jgi:hypothetical protein
MKTQFRDNPGIKPIILNATTLNAITANRHPEQREGSPYSARTRTTPEGSPPQPNTAT